MIIEEIFYKMCLCRYFETELIKHGVPFPTYLSMGQEAIGATLGVVCKDYDKVFPQHRGDAIYLGFGGDPKKLKEDILNSKGGSAGISSDKVEPHHGLIGENLPLACGYALATNKPTIAMCGDGGIEEDYALASLGFAATHKLPVLFVVEDNDLSILTRKEVRRSWDAARVAEAFGMTGVDVDDDVEKLILILENLDLPFFLNIHTERHRYHVGTGKDNEPTQDRLEEVRKLFSNSEAIEDAVRLNMEKLWQH
jgi:TPP-dependent pyruvate/acetoin dehydrogenase alpha subunit